MQDRMTLHVRGKIQLVGTLSDPSHNLEWASNNTLEPVGLMGRKIHHHLVPYSVLRDSLLPIHNLLPSLGHLALEGSRTNSMLHPAFHLSSKGEQPLIPRYEP